MDASHDVARHPGQGQSEVAARPATPPSPPITPWGRPGTPPTAAGKATIVATGPDDRPLANQARSRIADPIALVRANGSARPPSAEAGSSPDPAARAGRRDRPHGAAPLARREATSGRYQITQVELKALYELNQRLNQTKAEYAERRREFLERLGQGEVAEPGPYMAIRRESMQARVTIATLTEHLGEEYVEGLRQHLPRVKRVELRVTGPGKDKDRMEPEAKAMAQPFASDDDPDDW
jgi:hypothetical protein